MVVSYHIVNFKPTCFALVPEGFNFNQLCVSSEKKPSEVLLVFSADGYFQRGSFFYSEPSKAPKAGDLL
jgi:hypothetical protein